jgi:nicotinate dehydrogenase subunit A
MYMAETISLKVNGSVREVAAAEDTPLLYALRNDLNLKGTRFGCGAGHCGACHVLIDGHAVAACDTPLWAARGKEITTVEGLGTPQAPHALQRAFIAEQAAQCGYCIAGMMMSAKGLLDVNKDPTEADIRQALAGNLCRCGTHTRIIRAVQRAAKEMA